MKANVRTITALIFLFGAVAAAAVPKDAREVTCDGKKNILVLVAIGQTTLIVLPENELVRATFGGNDEWIIGDIHDKKLVNQAPPEPKRQLPVVPKAKAIKTVLTVTGNGGTDCSFYLTETSGDWDSRINIMGKGPQGSTSLAEIEWVPAAEDRVCKTQLALSQKRTDTEIDKAQREAREQIDNFRASYPKTVKHDYVWDRERGDKLGLRAIWHDKHFVYIQQDPAFRKGTVSELRDGKYAVANAPVDPEIKDGDLRMYIIIDRVIEQGEFAIGTGKNDKIEFKRGRTGS